MKLAIFSLLLFFIYNNSFAQVKNPFATIQYDSVVMYDYEPAREEGEIVYNGKLDGRIKKRVQLDKKTIGTIHNMVGKTSSYNNVVAGCFDPHLGLVYYKRGEIVGYMSVCLHCNGLYATPDIENRKPAISNSLRQFFNTLVKKYHFSNSIGQ